PVLLPGFLILLSACRRLDVLMTGEHTAASMGVSVWALRVQTVIGAALNKGAPVSLSGIIGFLGMMIHKLQAQTDGGIR
ncbi:iron chelate uptake ABC transporter family permease subunit, partial [Neisseria sp. P0001.S010]|uniref:iron chelate uptake ABC transporter family permease subunit n=1 Tax=Neisseria sp. P0001.S010 TaxID=3436654 RepID=UPI003F802BEC